MFVEFQKKKIIEIVRERLIKNLTLKQFIHNYEIKNHQNLSAFAIKDLRLNN